MTLETIGGRFTKRFEERTDPVTGERHLAVWLRGRRLKEDPLLNKGTCFTSVERATLGLDGLLPPAVATPEEQRDRAYRQYLQLGDDMERYQFLAALQDRNETLFYGLLSEHLGEMAPIVYTPTVERYCERYRHVYRRGRGLYVSSTDRGHMRSLLRNIRDEDVHLVVLTDNEAIRALGDQGVGAMAIAIGKLTMYTVAAGIHPALGLPIDLDVGTDSKALLEDPLYLGLRHPRLGAEPYFALLDELIEAISDVWPNAIVQWENFSKRTAFQVLERYGGQVPSFNDDIQCTGSMVVAGIRSALVQVVRPLEDERTVIFGAGAAGCGIARALRATLHDFGLTQDEIAARVLCIDSKGLILADRPGLGEVKREFAADPALVATWKRSGGGPIGLLDVVRKFKPTILIGASGQANAFNERIVRTMQRGCARPLIMPISAPPRLAEAKPADLLWWTSGAALVCSGSPTQAVEWRGRTIEIGHATTMSIFPGVALGAMAVGARWIPERVFRAASHALFEFTASSIRNGSGPIFPPLSAMRAVSKAVARAVGRTIVAAGAADPLSDPAIDTRLDEAAWDPVYLPYRPA